MKRLARQLFDALRELDRNATAQTFFRGELFPTGLRSLDKAIRPKLNPARDERTTYRTEDCIGDCLAGFLRTAGCKVRVRPKYPGSGEISDLQITLVDGRRIWLELKCAWKYDRIVPTKYLLNRAYKKHLDSTSEGFARDFHKLRRIKKSDGDFACALLIGFDLADSDFEITKSELMMMRSNADLFDDAREWIEEYEEWEDVHQAGDVGRHREHRRFRVRCWLWYCMAHEARTPAASSKKVSESSSTGKRGAGLGDIKWFCSVKYSQHGTRKKSGPRKGWYDHDWGDLVLRICRHYYCDELPVDQAWSVGNSVRQRFKNVSNWNTAVNGPGAHEEILEIILAGIKYWRSLDANLLD